ncbi:MAG: hypothetical protein WCI74_19285 [Actinomycetes bacterium]
MGSSRIRQLVFVLMVLAVAACGFAYAGSSTPWAGSSYAQLPTASTPAPPFVTQGTVTPTSVNFSFAPDLTIPGVAVPDVYVVVIDTMPTGATPAEPAFWRVRDFYSLVPGSTHTYQVYAGRTGFFGGQMWSDASTLIVTLPYLFNITPVSATGGSISPATVQAVTQGTDSPIFAVTPDPGYRVDQIKDGATVLGGTLKPDGSVEYQFHNVQAAHEISATFKKTWQIMAIAPTNGTITPGGTATVDQGATVAYTVGANPGYRIASVTDNGNPVSLTAGTYTLTNVTADHTLAATFEPNPAVEKAAVTLSKPSVPRSGKTKRAVRISGTVSSAIPLSTATPVTLEFYRWQKKNGRKRWVLRKTVTATRASAGEYAASLKVKPTGTWTVVALTAGDGEHLPATSPRSKAFKIK